LETENMATKDGKGKRTQFFGGKRNNRPKKRENSPVAKKSWGPQKNQNVDAEIEG